MNKVFYPMIMAIYLIVLIFISMFNTSTNYDPAFLILSIILIFLVLCIKMTLKEKNILSPELIFLVLFYVFHFGYLYIYELNLVRIDYEIFMFPHLVNISILYVTICATCFLLGYYLFLDFGIADYNNIKDRVNINRRGLLGSKFLLVLLLISFWMPILSLTPAIFYDYSIVSSIGEKGFGGRLYWFGQIIGISIVALYYVSKSKYTNRLIENWIDLIPFTIMIGSFAIGLRTYFLFYALVILVIYNSFYKKINFIKMSIITLMILTLSSVIAVSRVNSIYNPIEAISMALADSENNILINVIKEFGLSFKTIPFIVFLTDDLNYYWMGKSYFDSLLLILPNMFGEIRNADNNMDTWVTSQLFGLDTYGRGGSIAMEAYGNFGFIGGTMFFIFVGALTAKLYNKYRFKGDVYNVVIYLVFLGALVLWMRANSNFLFRILVWSLIITSIVRFFQRITWRL